MPQLSPVAVLQIALLLSAVPAQYFISKWSGATAVKRYHAGARLARLWKDWRSSQFNGTAWIDWADQQVSKIKSLVGLEEEEQVTTHKVPLQMLMYGNDQGFFGASKTVRSPRPPYVFLRVGDVVMERRGNMVGVVVSWDPELRAPAEWIDRMYANSENRKAENTPHYKVLFNGPSPESLFVAYIPQTQLERVTGVQPEIPTLEEYFTHFDGNRFILQPWLRELFPEDEDEDEDV